MLVVVSEDGTDPMGLGQACDCAVCETEFHIAPLLVKVPGLLQGVLVDFQEDNGLGGEDVRPQLNGELVVPCTRSTIGDRFIQYIV